MVGFITRHPPATSGSEKQSAAYAEEDVYQWTVHFGHCRGLPAFGPDISAEAAEHARRDPGVSESGIIGG